VSLDLAVLAAVGVFALLGALSGFARQVAQALAAVGAFFAAGPLGHLLGAWTGQQLGASLAVGTGVATATSFVGVYLAARATLTALVQRLLADRDDPESRVTDRSLGAVLGGLKAAALAFLGLCAVTFAERNLVFSGKHLALTPRDSVLVPLAREHNLLGHLQDSGASALARALQLATSPGQVKGLSDDPDYQALMKDPRFRGLLARDGLRGLLASGDLAGLMKLTRAAELLEDPRARARLERVGRLRD
jgi:membrane protein required for colicin V production